MSAAIPYVLLCLGVVLNSLTLILHTRWLKHLDARTRRDPRW